MKNAIIALWAQEADRKRAAALADLVLSLGLVPEDWLARWEGQPPPDWVKTIDLLPVDVPDFG
jgi:hypothetical protein